MGRAMNDGVTMLTLAHANEITPLITLDASKAERILSDENLHNEPNARLIKPSDAVTCRGPVEYPPSQ